jgi:hypothetical protein
MVLIKELYYNARPTKSQDTKPVFPSEGQNAIHIFLNIHLNRSCKYLLQSNSNLTVVKLATIGLITNHHNS